MKWSIEFNMINFSRKMDGLKEVAVHTIYTAYTFFGLYFSEHLLQQKFINNFLYSVLTHLLRTGLPSVCPILLQKHSAEWWKYCLQHIPFSSSYVFIMTPLPNLHIACSRTHNINCNKQRMTVKELTGRWTEIYIHNSTSARVRDLQLLVVSSCVLRWYFRFGSQFVFSICGISNVWLLCDYV